ncbi:SusC/RagA family TonB-linked outer membrane protein [Pontibacter toksunensis]|uniref:SusC/RagA family TonB-linked outer membrane protein n=1 Tax=Pontibacter toksunensis TaxID=1332631 RepID=A0ABW6BY40_9BACT
MKKVTTHFLGRYSLALAACCVSFPGVAHSYSSANRVESVNDLSKSALAKFLDEALANSGHSWSTGGTFAFQELAVTGKVTDESGVGLPGVTVLLKGTDKAAPTDASGNYTITVPDGNGTLVFSYIGFASQEVPVNNRSTINVTLGADAKALEEVVVVGYGTQKKSDVTGAVASANLEAFREAPNTNVVQSLQGTVPGLNIGQVTSAGATPEISIRGRSSLSGNQNVLIILDGIQYNGSLASINPNDIESIDILKDVSSTAVYGAQAANGVILVTTKGGKRNQKPQITINSSYATLSPTVDLRPMRRDEYIAYLERQLYQYQYLPPAYTTPNPDYQGYFGNNPGANVNFTLQDPNNPGNFNNTDFDWYDEGTQNSYILENKFSLSGASERVSYLLSLGLTEQEGLVKNDNFSRKSVRVNLDADATDWWNIGIQAFGSFINQDGDEPALFELRSFSPLLTPYDENGNLVRNPSGTIELNPFLAYDTEDYERHDYFFANLYSEINIPFIEGLSYRLNFGNNYRIDKQYGASIYGAGGVGDAGKYINFYRDYTLDNILKYNRVFGKHDLGATLLYGAIERKGEDTDIYVSNFNRLSLGYNDLNVGSVPVPSSGAFTESLNYQMFRVNYKFDNRYIFTGTIRRDGFSAFAENQKTAYFPSGALGWNVSNEAFMQDVSWVNNLKFRVSYGISGNQTGRYSSLARLTTRAAYVFGDGAGPAFGQELTSLPNPNLRWEKTTGLNLGLDFGLFSNRLQGSIDVYNNITNDLLFAVRVPYLTGFNSIQTNLGEVQNKGVELSLTGDVVRSEDFSWSATTNFSANRNKIISLTGEDADGDGVEDDLIQNGLFIGQPINAIYGYEVNGIYQIGEDNIIPGYGPGNYRVVDQNGDGIIAQADDRRILGTRDPAFRASLLNTFTYKNFSLNIFFNSVQGGDEFYIAENDNALYRNANTLWLNHLSGIDYWSPQNPGGLNALAAGAPGIAGTRFENRSFVRLQDVNLSYNFDQALLERFGIEGLSLFVSGKNLATWTDWRGWDPETGVGLDRGGRPVLKAYSVGLNLTL